MKENKLQRLKFEVILYLILSFIALLNNDPPAATFFSCIGLLHCGVYFFVLTKS